jgi:hypothetical protein
LIRGIFDPANPDYPLPFVNTAVHLPGLTATWTIVPFLIDTGAGSTSIHVGDALNLLGLQRTVLEDPAAWDRHERHTGVGGVGLYYIVPARYGLLEAHGEWQLFDADIRIASLTRESPGIPSVLGWDILRRFAIAMDWSRKIVELH